MSVPRGFQIWVHEESSHAVKAAIVLCISAGKRTHGQWPATVGLRRGPGHLFCGCSGSERQVASGHPYSTSPSPFCWVVSAELLLTCQESVL